MYCENCGKKLIRGYQFCMECGTPVPPDEDEEEQQSDQQPEAQQGTEMPGIKPLGSDEGTLVYCPTCGMRMQRSTDFCEKCGMRLSGNSQTNSGVPLVNSDPLGGDFTGISDNDIAQIDNFVNNSGFNGGGISYNTGYQDHGIGGGFGGGSLNSEIEALNQQFANLNSTASDMPAISAPPRQPEPAPAPVPTVPEPEPFARRVDNFSMEAGMPETQFLSESGLPVINGGEMSEPDVPVELEHHLDDINIDAPAFTAPAYTEPAYEAPTYTEPVAEVPTYNEPVAETPAYTKPVAEVPAYTEPAYEAPTYNEPVAETPASDVTAPEDDLSTVLLSKNDQPDYDRTVMLSSLAPASPAGNDDLTDTSANTAEDGGVDLGKLVYCRNCGQDMYEKEPVCKNCGSPNKWNQKPLRHDVSDAKNTKKNDGPAKLFGVIPIPAVIGGGVVVAGVIALLAFSSAPKNDPDPITKPNTTTASTSADAQTPVESSQPDESSAVDVTSQSEPVTEPVEIGQGDTDPIVTDSRSDDVSQPDENSVPEETTTPSDTSKPDTTSTTKPATTTKPGTSTTKPATTTKPAATTKPATTTKPVTTTKPAVTTQAPSFGKPSATVSSEDKQRAKMLDAFEAISAEVGKVHVYAQATEFALENGKSRTFYTSSMSSTLSSGKSNAASLLKGAKPSSGELSSAYSALEKLYDLYVDYYNYVTTSTDGVDTYSSKEITKWDAFNSSVKNSFGYSKLQTKNQTDSDKSRTYSDIMTDASSAAANAVTQFTSVQGAVENLKSSKYDDEVMSTIYNTKTSAILKAAGYAQVVTNYYGMLSSGVPSAYSSAKTALSSTSSHIDELLGVFTQAGYNDLSGFKKEAAASIKKVNNDIYSVNSSL
ncbi:MAG: zinc ribbon domain-containing protein [Oscillospiraceae bacterium]|nr:zinc ribbon domain-containing protein [Oscillospiraceae bacterium]